MPLPTSVMLSRCCITWMSPSTAPRMPMVGENPPADSNTEGRRSSPSVVESRLTCMILRRSEGSVPSTASITVCFRKGSWMVCRSASSETTPLRRALLAKAIRSLMSSSLCLRGAAKTCAMRRNAAVTVVSGNWSNTAPIVPPNTMSAAVGCRIWPRLPPSISSPATMPAMARSTPPTLALSMDDPSQIRVTIHAADLSAIALRCFHFALREEIVLTVVIEAGERRGPFKTVRGFQPLRHRGQQAGTIVEYPFQYLGAAFAHDHLLAVDQGQHGIGRGLGCLDQIAVQYHGVSVEPGHLDHGGKLLPRSYRRTEKKG